MAYDVYNLIRNGTSTQHHLDGLRGLQNIYKVTKTPMVINEIPDVMLMQLFRNIDSPVKNSAFSFETYASYFSKAKLDLKLTSDLVEKGRVEAKLLEFFGRANPTDCMGAVYNISMEKLYSFAKVVLGDFSFKYDGHDDLNIIMNKIDKLRNIGIKNVDANDLDELCDNMIIAVEYGYKKRLNLFCKGGVRDQILKELAEYDYMGHDLLVKIVNNLLERKISNGEKITRKMIQESIQFLKQNLSNYKNDSYRNPNNVHNMSKGSDYDEIDDPHIEGRIRF